MLNAVHLYMRYIEISVRSQMQYRASFVMLSFGHLLATGVEFVAILVLFARFDNLQGWTLHEVAFLYGMVNIAFSYRGRRSAWLRPVRKHGQVRRLRPPSDEAALHGAPACWAGT